MNPTPVDDASNRQVDSEEDPMQRSSATPAAGNAQDSSRRRQAPTADRRGDRSLVSAPTRGIVRPAVLAGALALGLALGPWWQPNLAGAADDAAAVSERSSAPASASPASASPATEPQTAPSDKSAAGSAQAPEAGGEITISPHGIVISGTAGTDREGKRIDVQHGRVKVEGFGSDRQYDSFEQFMNDAPATALFAFLIVTVVFLVPLLVIALLVWYKIRKTRMHNEAMLKLAERGAVSPATAMEAIAAGVTPAAALDALGKGQAIGPAPGPAPGGAPLYDQVRMIRRRNAWSDLRKGVILIAIGVALSAYSLFDDGTPNGAGLICLFLGIGYCILWFFQDQPRTGPNQTPPSPPGGA